MRGFIIIWGVVLGMGRKHIRIGDEQEEYIEENHINLSSFVREQIEAEYGVGVDE